MIAFIDYRCTNEEINSLKKQNILPIKVPKSNLVYDAINGHVDIQLNVIDKNNKTIIIHKDIPKNFLKILDANNVNYVFSSSSLKNIYPEDIILNAVITKDYFIHNLSFSDKKLLEMVKDRKMINVSQGYTKCSVLPIKDDIFLTSDKGIYKVLSLEHLTVLYVPPGDILLPSMNYGFIGGAGGMINDNTLAFFGDLNEYKYGKMIIDFLKEYSINVLSLKPGKLIDRGSLLTIP